MTDDESGEGQGMPTAASHSPSIVGDRALAEPAYELKFLADRERTTTLLALAQDLLLPDPHGRADRPGSYRIATLYFDTPDFAVYHGFASVDRVKHRIRRYDDETRLWLERKERRSDRVAKLRDSVGTQEVAALLGGVPATAGPGAWFVEAFHRLDLRPVCQVDYLRSAFYLDGDAARGRLTIDEAIRGRRSSSSTFDPDTVSIGILEEQFVVEVKFRGLIPDALKRIVNEAGLAPTKLSKYRHIVQALGIAV